MGPVPLHQHREDLGCNLLAGLLPGDTIAVILGLALANQWITRVQQRYRTAQGKAVKHGPRLVAFVDWAERRYGDPIGAGQREGRPRIGRRGRGRLHFGPALLGQPHQCLLTTRKRVPRGTRLRVVVFGHPKTADRFGRGCNARYADLLSQVRQGRDVILPRRFQLVDRRLVFHLGQDHVGRRRLVGFGLPAERLHQGGC